jgi:BirA family transcriptional regulator, biotin operon repressor / biotin---[acetyl-CoA-carboxylase] ligase
VPSGDPFPLGRLSLRRLLHRLGTVDSTQLAAAGMPLGSVVVADHQTAGRGRQGRSWEAPTGSGLFVTFVLEPCAIVVFAAGVAAAEACGNGVLLKWPNDLILDDRKLGGILAEIRHEHALVGIGINLSWAPAGAARLGADRDLLLELLLPLMKKWTEAEPEAVIQRWRELSWTLGQQVRVELGGEVIEGMAEDVAEDGALLVGGRRVIAGDVTRVRAI